MLKYQVVYLGVICVVLVSSVEYSRHVGGYPAGYFSDCSKARECPNFNPKSISISFMGNYMRSKLIPYSYYQMNKLAKHIDFKNKTVLCIGNHAESFSMSLVRRIGELYRDLGYNVLIFVPQFTRKYYPEAVSFVRPFGKHIAEMLAKLTSLGLNPKKLELVGQNLGAHTMSFVAKSYRRITGRNISSLTALNPAGPCFRNLGPAERLDPSDADFVLNMATNIDGFGMATPVGHVTFYVNGGEHQQADIWFLPCTLECSDAKAFIFWMSALLNPHIFIGVQCDTIQQAREGDCYDRKPKVWNSMDLFTDRSKPGIYYLPTQNRYPYGLGKKGLIKENSQVANFYTLMF